MAQRVSPEGGNLLEGVARFEQVGSAVGSVR